MHACDIIPFDKYPGVRRPMFLLNSAKAQASASTLPVSFLFDPAGFFYCGENKLDFIQRAEEVLVVRTFRLSSCLFPPSRLPLPVKFYYISHL